MRRIDALLVVALLTVAPRAECQLPILLEGIVDGEAWTTTPASNLLTRNGGRASTLGRLQLWGAVEPFARFVIYAQGDLEGGSGRERSESNASAEALNQYGVRFTASQAFVLDAGKLQPVVGTFASRRFSNRNPLIGTPDGYTLDYPMGAMVSGETKHFDYRVAMVDLPATHRSYVPPPSRRFRPAAGAGFTPIVGLRFGGSFTVGSYLNRHLTTEALRGQEWSASSQRVFALDASLARGYFEARVEASHGSYDVPGRSEAIAGYAYYGEVKYTFTPRFFVAGRAERNYYPFIRATATAVTARLTDFVNGELGAGYRVSTTTLVKASMRGDRWWVAQNSPGFLGRGGGAMALQVSQSFDVMSWFTRRQ
jgi:hypothetical protein